MKQNIASAFVLILSLLVHHVTHAAIAGPYCIKVKSITNCPTDEVPDQVSPLDLSVKSIIRYNHTRKIPIIDANVSTWNGVFVRGASKIKLEAARWDSVSGWRKNFLVMPLGELCFVYEVVVPETVQVMADVTGVSTKCPVADGDYGGFNAPAKLSPMRHFPALPYGRYRVHVLFLFNKPRTGPRVRGCMRIVTDVLPWNE